MIDLSRPRTGRKPQRLYVLVRAGDWSNGMRGLTNASATFELEAGESVDVPGLVQEIRSIAPRFVSRGKVKNA